jgi:PncC family amidohydrolase
VDHRSRPRPGEGATALLTPDDPSGTDDLAGLVALAQGIQALMIERSLTLATAESCTGGLIGHVLTEVPGSSAYFLGGLVCYSDPLKSSELGVDQATLQRHGAVSAQVCVAMAEGARLRYGAALSIAVTGIAGPDGGTPAKPVGLTYVSVADEAGHDVRRHAWASDRHGNKVYSAEAALRLLLERLGA